jgi:hypothetical protein
VKPGVRAGASEMNAAGHGRGCVSERTASDLIGLALWLAGVDQKSPALSPGSTSSPYTDFGVLSSPTPFTLYFSQHV